MRGPAASSPGCTAAQPGRATDLLAAAHRPRTARRSPQEDKVDR